jgi:O-antigen/teichoic acid export membrane protein
MEEEKLSLTRQSQILILGQAISFAFNFLVPIIVVRFFDVAEYGVYKQLFLIIMTVAVILPFGIAESLFYFIPRNKERQQHYITQTLYFLTFSGLIFLAIMFLYGDNILSVLNLSHLHEYTYLLTFYIIFMNLSLPLERILTSQERVKASSFVAVISELLKGICIVISTVITSNLKIVMYSLVCFSFLRIIGFFYFLISRNLIFFSIKKFDTQKIREQARYSFPFGLAVVVATIRRFFHQYFISFLFAPKDFAIYAVGSFQLPLMNVIYATVSSVILIRASEYHQEKKIDKILEVWLSSSRKLALIYFPVTFLFILSSKEFIPIIFTSQYLSSIPFFIVTLLQLPVDVFVTHSILKAYAKNTYILQLNIISLILTAILVYILTYKFGMIGAIIGTTVSYTVVRALEVVIIKRLTGVNWNRFIPWKIFLRIISICSLCAVAVIFIKNINLSSSAFGVFIMESGLFSLLYVLMIYFSGVLSKSEKEDFKKIIYKFKPALFLR